MKVSVPIERRERSLSSSLLEIARPAISLLILLSLGTGLIYPALVTGAAQLLFPVQANGSLIEANGQLVGSRLVGSRLVGSRLIGQSFTSARYFWSRPSATMPAYNAGASGASNYGPTNSALTAAAKTRIAVLHAADPTNTGSVPVDLVTASASGLDPDISIAGARYQSPRVARERGLELATVNHLISTLAEYPLLGWLGEPRVNVLRLNLALDELVARPVRPSVGSS